MASLDMKKITMAQMEEIMSLLFDKCFSLSPKQR